MEIERFGDRGFLSDVTAFGPMIWIAGIVPARASITIEDQTLDVLTELDRRLAAVGSRKSSLLNVNIWLLDMTDWDAMNRVWSEWLDGAQAPARAVVGAALLEPFKIEIAGTAVRSTLS